MAVKTIFGDNDAFADLPPLIVDYVDDIEIASHIAKLTKTAEKASPAKQVVLTPREPVATSSALGEGQVQVASNTQGHPNGTQHTLTQFPVELIGEISTHLDQLMDLVSMRMASVAFSVGAKFTFNKRLVDDRTIYPSETLREHEHGYEWALEEVQHEEEADMFRPEDMAILSDVVQKHMEEARTTFSFVNSGRYRQMLNRVFLLLPNLQKITVRKLHKGEHIPGWNGPELLKSLSYYHDKLNTNDVFYGDWQYDTIHRRVTVHTDEYGMTIREPGSGPQASFDDDVRAAMRSSNTRARLESI